ncbi:hypothetical protein ACFQZE_08725 [Paenibacillus sp. GCM10027627]|uniref:hypothetical protein n=1 Tax=unclassified Paenibacillus TaxID=185978 RepID=UPI0036253CB2
MRLEDALFNWLQIKIVAEARPGDGAATDTLLFFEQVLREDHGLDSFELLKTDDTMIHVRYVKEARAKLQMYPRETGEQLLQDIINNPKYN